MSLFSPHLDLAFKYWKRLLRPGDWAIDATCGNGKDTVRLANLLDSSGGLVALDIQEEAIQSTKKYLTKSLTPEKLAQIHLLHQSHEEFPSFAKGKPIRLIVYNLGYLPGGNKKKPTIPTTTLRSVKEFMPYLLPEGALSITCYPGHKAGQEEQELLLNWVQTLDRHLWDVTHHEWKDRTLAPSLLLIQKNII
ncbi:MAG: class I SAM-dependent methyltransferase [Chlamydiae bacterium]|nr:class I SAM-dependent methyltransferase [Chlamydiota bacterium]